MSRKTDRRKLFEQCIESYSGSMYRVAFRMTGNATLARELVQETSLAAWQNLDSLHDPDRMKAWIFGILRNQYTKLIRKEKRVPTASNVIHDIPQNPASDTQALHETVQQSVSELDEKHRLPLVLVSIEGLSVDEAAGILQVPRGTVLSRLSRARDKLKDILKRNGVVVVSE